MVLGSTPSGRLYKALVPTKKATAINYDATTWFDPGILELDASVADNVTPEARRRYLALLHEYGVHQVFAGHYHRDAEAHQGDLDMIITGPVGMPLKGGKSGMRIVSVAGGKVTHKYHDFGELPQAIQ